MPNTKMRWLMWGTLVLVVLALAAVFNVPTLVDRRMNTVIHPAPYAAGAQATTLHQGLFVADQRSDAFGPLAPEKPA